MIMFLEKTSYQEFDAWLCNKAGKHGFLVSYDSAGLIDDMGDVDRIPKKIYPLRIYLTKLNKDGIGFDNDGFFIIEKVGENLQVCPKAYNDHGLKRLKPILEEIEKAWPRALINRDFLLIENPESEKDPPGKKPNKGYDAAFPFWHDGKKDYALNFWRGTYSDESLGMSYSDAKRAFDKAMDRREKKLNEVRNPK